MQSISLRDLLGLPLPTGTFYSYLKGLVGHNKVIYSNWPSHQGTSPCLPSGLAKPATRGAPAWASHVSQGRSRRLSPLPYPWQYHPAASARMSGKLLGEQHVCEPHCGSSKRLRNHRIHWFPTLSCRTCTRDYRQSLWPLLTTSAWESPTEWVHLCSPQSPVAWHFKSCLGDFYVQFLLTKINK